MPGLPIHWTDPAVGLISQKHFDNLFPTQASISSVMLAPVTVEFACVQYLLLQACAAKKLPCISLFTGVAGLEVGLREPVWHALHLEEVSFKSRKTCCVVSGTCAWPPSLPAAVLERCVENKCPVARHFLLSWLMPQWTTVHTTGINQIRWAGQF